MKKVLLILTLPICLVLGQDQPELPGWGVYVGAGSYSATIEGVDADSVKRATLFPSIGVTKGVMVGGLPLIVGAGYHQRGYVGDSFFGETTMSYNTLDLWATVPYPVGPVALSAGFIVGTFLNGKLDLDGAEIDLEDDMLPDGLDYGLILGLGYPAGPVNLNLGYALGLADHDGGSFNGLLLNVGYDF